MTPNAETANECNEFPYNQSEYRSNRTMLTLDLLDGTSTFNEIFAGSVKSKLTSCRSRVDAAIQRATNCLGPDLPNEFELKSKLDAATNALPEPVTLRNLMTQPQPAWPAGVLQAFTDLYNAGFYIQAQMIPDSAKSSIADFFSPGGSDFLGIVGALTMREYFENPRSSYTSEVLELLFVARRLGVLLCHQEATLLDKNGRCWSGSNCVSTNQEYVCNGDSGSSDLCL